MSRVTRHRDFSGGGRGNREESDHPASTTKAMWCYFAIVALGCVVALLTFPLVLPGGPRRTQAAGHPLPPLFDTAEVRVGLPPPEPGTRVPVNTVDRFTGQPIIASSPTVTYKGFVVAFCCRHSPGYRGGWDRLTEAEKDTYIRTFLK